MNDTSRTFLLIADISGFTGFMRQKSISLNHAKQIVVRLLKAVMSVSSSPLKVAELEGDAVFFYAEFRGSDAKSIATIKDQMLRLFAAFERERASIENVTTCSCDACVQVTDLKLKQVAHVGDVVIETIGRFEKLFGLDVILVHRLLKNSVQAREYVMITRPVYESMGEFFELLPERRIESYEGVGEVETLVFYPEGLLQQQSEGLSRGNDVQFLEKLGWRGELSLKFLLDFVGIRRIR